jgi:hypothetical protein
MEIRNNYGYCGIRYGANISSRIVFSMNENTEYGKGYKDAIYDVYKEMAKTFKSEAKGLK